LNTDDVTIKGARDFLQTLFEAGTKLYLASGSVFLVHFEKGVDSYRGVYQFVNRATARALPETVRFINREQDLGDEGLRQAKMTYRPESLVKKYWIKKV